MKTEIDKSFEQLEYIRSLKPNWNGYEAKPFSAALIDKCKRIVSLLSVQPEISPVQSIIPSTESSNIQFCYEIRELRDRKICLVFEIFEDKTVCRQLCQKKGGGLTDTETELTNLEDVRIKEIVDNYFMEE